MAKFVCLRDKLSDKKVRVKVLEDHKVSKKNWIYPKGVQRVFFGKIDGKGKEYAFIIPKRYSLCR